MQYPLTPLQEQQVRQEIAAGRTIQAIKLYREYTDVGLKEAKDAVEAMQRSPSSAWTGGAIPGVPTTQSVFGGRVDEGQSPVHQEVLDLMRTNKKIQAIKVYRAATHVGLKEAKDAVEAIAEGRSVQTPQGKSRLELRAEKQSGGGCLGMIAIAVTLSVLAWAMT